MYTKTVAICVVALFAVFQLGQSLKCFSCDGDTACKAKKLSAVTCNETLANNTQLYLQTYYNTNSTHLPTASFACFKNNITAADNSTLAVYKGCIFDNVQACNLTLKSSVPANAHNECEICKKDKCNSAGKTPVSLWTSSLVVLIAFIAKTSF